MFTHSVKKLVGQQLSGRKRVEHTVTLVITFMYNKATYFWNIHLRNIVWVFCHWQVLFDAQEVLTEVCQKRFFQVNVLQFALFTKANNSGVHRMLDLSKRIHLQLYSIVLLHSSFLNLSDWRMLKFPKCLVSCFKSKIHLTFKLTFVLLSPFWTSTFLLHDIFIFYPLAFDGKSPTFPITSFKRK